MPSFTPLREIPGLRRTGINLTGSTLPAARGVTGTEASIALPATNHDTFFGVLCGDTADQAAGTVQQSGKAIVQIGAAGATAGHLAGIEAATGKFVDWAPATGVNATLAGVFEQAGAADAYIEMTIGAPGVIGQGP